MALIETVDPASADGLLAEIYADISGMIGFVPNAVRLDSINPDHLARHWAEIKEAMQHPSLSQPLFATIRLLASEMERCEYCVGLNAGMLMQMCKLDVDAVNAIKADPDAAPLDGRESALLRFVMKALKDSNSTDAADIQVLRDAGLSDREIFDALAHGAQQIAADIILNAFKVDPDLH
ncbi:MAG: hypothetical protein KDG50_07320 [Chromatiales bacterium]|nr:hypothetical protein [Chromatiales bacterium]